MKRLSVLLVSTIISSPAAAITTEVPAGEVWSGTMVDSPVTQNVLGTTNNVMVLGQQIVKSGGVTNGSNLYSYSAQTVESGGVSNGTNIQYRAFQKVYGEARNTAVSGGSITVYSGGKAFDTMINSGSQVVYGTDSNATVASGARQVVKSSGVASGTKIYGQQDVDGTAENTILYGGTQVINENAVFKGGTNNGGSLYIYDYADVSDLTVNGGETVIYPNVDLKGKTALNNSGLLFYDNAVIDDLSMNNGVVEMFSLGQGELTMNNLSGQGTFKLVSNFSGGYNDKLIVNNGSGTFGLTVVDYSLDETLPDQVHLVEQNGGSEQFYLTGGAMDAGAFEYELVHSGDEWRLQRTTNNTDTSILAKNTFSSLNSIFYAHLRNLNTRLGETHFTHTKGLWVRGIGRKVELNYKDDTESDIDISGVQAGFDLDLNQSLVDSWSVGISTAVTSADQEFDRLGKGDGKTNSVSLYSTMVNADKQYLDLAGTYYHHRQKLVTYMPSALPVFGKYNLDGWSVSAEAGQRFDFQDGWFAEPQLQATYMWLDDVTYRTNYHTKISGKNQDSLLARIGVMGGKHFSETLSFPFTVFAKAGVLREFRNKSDVTVANYTFDEDLEGTMVELGVGLSADVNENNSLYLNVSTYMGDEIDVPLDLNFGFRHNF